MNKKIIWLIIFLVVASVAYWWWGGSKKEVSGEPIKVGVVTFPTGPLAAFGQISINAINLAVEEINKAGGVNGRQVEAIIEDYAYDAKLAVPAYQSLVSRGIKLFFIDGSSAAGSISPLIKENKHFSIAPSTVLPAYTDNNPLTCRLALKAQNYGPAIANFIANKFTNPRVAFLVSNNEYGKGVESEVILALEKLNGSVIIAESFDQAVGDFRTQIAKLKEKEKQIDVLVVINAANTVEAMFKQLNELKFNKPIVTDNWTAGNPQLKTKDLVEGVFYADYSYSPEAQEQDLSATAEFKKGYFEKYNSNPSPHAANSYDAIKILLLAVAEVGDNDPEAISDFLVNKLGEYNGVGGKFTFDSDCEVSRDIKMRVINKGEVETIE